MGEQRSPSGRERRSWPRARVRTGIKVEIIGRNSAVVLTNVGPGGFAIASDDMLASVSRRQFKFTAPDSGWSVVLNAQMAYCLLQPRQTGIHQGRFLTGFMFDEDVTTEVREQLEQYLKDRPAVS